MLVSKRLNSYTSANNFVLIGLGVAVFYWFLESGIHVLFFGRTRFFSELITPDLHEIWKRLLVVVLLVLFGAFSQQYFNYRKRTEKALIESQKKFATIFKEALNPIFMFDAEGRFIDHNLAALQFMGCNREELLSKTFDEMTGRRFQSQNSEASLPGGQRRVIEIDLAIGGQNKTMLLNIVPLNIGEKDFVYGIGQDITSRKQMERTLRQAHAELDQIFQTASVGMRVVDRNYNVLRVNQTFAKMTGIEIAAAQGAKCYEMFSGDMCRTPGCPISRILSGEIRFEAYVDKKRPDGARIPCILTATPFSGADGEVVGIVESFRDITQLKQAQEMIRTEHDKLHGILSSLLEGVSIINANYTIEFQNPVLEKMFGACQGKKCYQVFRDRKLPCKRCTMRQAIGSGRIHTFEFENRAGRSFEQVYSQLADIDGQQKVVVLTRDVTEKKETLAAIMHAEQLAAVGELAAGVAHEINNPINGIINYAQLILNRSTKGEMINEVAERMVREGDRIARIVASLLSFSSRRYEEKKQSSVKEILVDALTLSAVQMRKENINVIMGFPETLPPIMVHYQEIEQVFINIISNARYALNQKYPGNHQNKRLEITGEAVRFDDRNWVRVSFLDHGVGISPKIKAKVGKPFFSTKTDSKRTGLGLSISYGIVNRHGGNLSVESREGLFTCVSVTLPTMPNEG